MTKTEIQYYLKKISRENILNAFQELDESEKSTQSMIRQYVIRNDDKTYPPPETIRIAYEKATKEKLPDGFFASIGEGSEHFKFIRENRFELNLLEGRNKFYLKRLLENELGYRNGVPTAGETFMISKEAAWNFFPPLGIIEKNDNRKLLISRKFKEDFHSVTYTYHNGKFFGGTRNEFRIYLTADLLTDFRKLVPNDLVLISSVNDSDNKYEMIHFKKGDEDYNFFNELLGTDNHFLTNKINDPISRKMLNKNSQMPLNQILFGPPGTGKTYSTITKALNIIGLLEEKESYTKEEYDKAQELFQNELGKRIEFVTMHQSFSYEDFVQGLKPIRSEDGKDITFDYKNGVFKEVCRRADLLRKEFNLDSNQGRIDFEVVYNYSFKSLFEDNEPIVIERGNTKFVIHNFSEKTLWFETSNGTTHPRYTLAKKTLKKIYDAQINDVIKSGNKGYFDAALEFLLENEKKIKENGQVRSPSQNLNHVIILDEINRANISRVFGELIALIEKDKRDGKLTATLPSGEPFTVPSNLFIIGTMNTADKSIALVDIALRRRFEFIPLYPDTKVLANVLKENRVEEAEIEKRVKLLTNLNKIIRTKKSVDFEIGHSYFMENDTLINIFNNQVLPLLNEYFMYDLIKVKEIIEKTQKDKEGNKITKLGITLNQTKWKDKGLLEVENIDEFKEQNEDEFDEIDANATDS